MAGAMLAVGEASQVVVEVLEVVPDVADTGLQAAAKRSVDPRSLPPCQSHRRRGGVLLHPND